MKTLYLLFLLLLLNLLSLQTRAQLREIEGAKNLASVYLNEIYSEEVLTPAKLHLHFTYSSAAGIPEIYCFNNDGKAYVLISAEKRTRVVLAYSNTPISPGENLPPSLSSLIESYRMEIIFTRKNLPSVQEGSAVDAGAGKGNVVAVTPLITTNWDQTCLYNDSCPADPLTNASFCGHVPVGCVGTTLAQLMKFHQYPAYGTGSKSYVHVNYGLLTADFGNTNYSWAAMPDELQQPSSIVAQLMFHCGVAVSMNYGTYASGANLPDARLALINYFGYSNGSQIVHLQNYSQAAWQSLMQAEIDSARPVIYSAVDPNAAGHAWLLDGYQSNGMFHCNWGWGGFYNGYYALTALNPGLNNFTAFHEAIIGIKPQVPVLTARFSAGNAYIQAGSNVNFTDLSSGSPSFWSWSFPGGSPSSSASQQPTGINYALPGKYDVSLTVVNAQDTSVLVKQNYIWVTPLANFSADKVSIAAGQSIQFADASISAATITSWQWSFSGGTPSSSGIQNPAPVYYQNAGLYDVSLMVQSGASSHTKTYQGMIRVYSSCDTLFNCPLPGYIVDSANQQGFMVQTEDLDGNTPYFGGPPTNHTSNWMVFNDVISAGDTNFFYGVTSWFTPPGISDDWLAFGPLQVPAQGLTIQWEHMYWIINKRDGYEVRISTTGIGHSDFTIYPHFVLADNGPQSDGDSVWSVQEANIDGSMYGGQDVYIAFHHNANNMSYLFIDNIRVIACQGLAVGIEDDVFRDEVIVYPNPAGEYLNIGFEDIGNRDSEFEVFDAYGNRLIAKTSLKISGNTAKIMLPPLPAGVYFISIYTEDGVRIVKKFLKY